MASPAYWRDKDPEVALQVTVGFENLYDKPANGRNMAEAKRGQAANQLGLSGTKHKQDSKIAHLTPGEIVIPLSAQTPELIRVLNSSLGRNLSQYIIGSGQENVNPESGLPAFTDLIGDADLNRNAPLQLAIDPDDEPEIAKSGTIDDKQNNARLPTERNVEKAEKKAKKGIFEDENVITVSAPSGTWGHWVYFPASTAPKDSSLSCTLLYSAQTELPAAFDVEISHSNKIIKKVGDGAYRWTIPRNTMYEVGIRLKSHGSGQGVLVVFSKKSS